MRIIAHLDMDAFFAAVEERDDPKLRGLPIAVGADPREGQGRGVVSTANYKAREYGLRSALPISQAWRLSERARRAGWPPVVFLTPDFDKYSAASEKAVSIVRRHVSVIERAGIDEMYLDLSSAGSYARAEEICRQIKKEIREEEKLTASIGLAPNKLVAKIASDAHKPDGLTIVQEDEVSAFLAPLSVRRLPGIGPKTEARLNAMDIRTIQHLRGLSLQKMTDLLGKWGEELFLEARGKDDSPVEESGEVKSIGEQETFLEDTLDANSVLGRVEEMAGHLIARLKEEGFGGFRTVVVTVRFADFDTKTRSFTLKNPAATKETLLFVGLKLLLPFLDKRSNPNLKKVRLVGLRLEKLQPEPG